jgi:hypothetical protein
VYRLDAEPSRLKLDPKVTADQLGRGVGVAIEEYTKTSVKDRVAAANKLEQEGWAKKWWYYSRAA